MTCLRPSWKRIAAIAIGMLALAAALSAAWLWNTARTAPRFPSGLAIEQARWNLDADIALLNQYGSPTSSLLGRCDVGSPDAIQAFQRPGMMMPDGFPAAIALHGDRLTTARLHIRHSVRPGAAVDTSRVSSDGLGRIWSEADRLIEATMSASPYDPDTWATDSGEIAVEVCRHGRYASIERYLGSPDPDNRALARFNDRLWELSREATVR